MWVFTMEASEAFRPIGGMLVQVVHILSKLGISFITNGTAFVLRRRPLGCRTFEKGFSLVEASENFVQ